MSVDGGDDVQQACNNDKFSAIVGDGGLHRSSPPAGGAAEEVEEATAQITGDTEHVENVLRAGVELALHGEAERKHGDDGDGEQSAADPFAEEKVACAGDEPPGDEGKVDESF